MITDPEQVQNLLNGLQKLTDSTDKFCEVRLAPSTSHEDLVKLVTYLDQIAATKQNLSLLLPP